MTTAAERQRRYRERKKLGLSTRRVYLDRFQERLLVDAGLLDPAALDDGDLFAEQLADALEVLLSRNGIEAGTRDTGPDSNED